MLRLSNAYKYPKKKLFLKANCFLMGHILIKSCPFQKVCFSSWQNELAAPFNNFRLPIFGPPFHIL